MARGNPDYNVPDYTFFSIETPNSDVLAEHSGFSRLDNRGRILFMDDFKNGLTRWTLNNDVPGLAPAQIYQAGLAIGYNGAIKLDPVGVGGVSDMSNHFLLPVSKLLGFEIAINIQSNFGDIQVSLQHCFVDGVGKAISMNIAHNTGAIKIDTTLGFVTIATPAAVSYFTNRWLSIKVVADFSTGQYVRMMLGNTQYNIEQYFMGDGFTGFSGASFVELGNSAFDATYKAPAYIGYAIVSGDEP